jgi:hypothetical protein
VTDRPRRTTEAKPPISAHPAFPAIVALWFAALLGIGSLVLPAALFERASEASGLSSVFVAAQAPLGVTARILIALGAATVGIFAGLGIAGRVIAANATQPAPRRGPAAVPAGHPAAKRPISAREELGSSSLDTDDARGPIPGRRRALSVTDDSARSEFLESAPLPGFDPRASVDTPEPEPEPEAEPDVEAEFEAAAAEPLDLGSFDAAPAEAPAADDEGDEPAARFSQSATEQTFGTASLSARPIPNSSFGAGGFRTRPVNRPPREAAAEAFEDSPMTEFSAGAVPVQQTAPGEPAIVELVDRFARALRQHREEAGQGASVDGGDPAAPLIDLTFALAPRDRRDRAPAPSDRSKPVEAFQRAFEAPLVPAALRPLDFAPDEDEDDDGIPSLDLSLTLARSARPFARPPAAFAPPPADPDEQSENDAGAEGAYSSLLAMKSPAGLPREAVRIDDEPEVEDAIEPVVVFPGQSARRAVPAADGPARDPGPDGMTSGAARPFDAPLDRLDTVAGAVSGRGANGRPGNAANTERALREALEKLQKMSGTA